MEQINVQLEILADSKIIQNCTEFEFKNIRICPF
jgi:hypothetical protein